MLLEMVDKSNQKQEIVSVRTASNKWLITIGTGSRCHTFHFLNKTEIQFQVCNTTDFSLKMLLAVLDKEMDQHVSQYPNEVKLIRAQSKAIQNVRVRFLCGNATPIVVYGRDFTSYQELQDDLFEDPDFILANVLSIVPVRDLVWKYIVSDDEKVRVNNVSPRDLWMAPHIVVHNYDPNFTPSSTDNANWNATTVYIRTREVRPSETKQSQQDFLSDIVQRGLPCIDIKLEHPQMWHKITDLRPDLTFPEIVLHNRIGELMTGHANYTNVTCCDNICWNNEGMWRRRSVSTISTKEWYEKDLKAQIPPKGTVSEAKFMKFLLSEFEFVGSNFCCLKQLRYDDYSDQHAQTCSDKCKYADFAWRYVRGEYDIAHILQLNPLEKIHSAHFMRRNG
jgi:hypothetical protein